MTKQASPRQKLRLRQQIDVDHIRSLSDVFERAYERWREGLMDVWPHDPWADSTGEMLFRIFLDEISAMSDGRHRQDRTQSRATKARV